MKRATIAAVMMLMLVAAGPATQPTADDYPALRKRLAELTAQVTTLTAERDELKKQNADLLQRVAALAPATQPVAKKIPKTEAELHDVYVRDIHMGMSYEAVTAILGKQRGETREGAILKRWYQAGNYTVFLYFQEDGTLVDSDSEVFHPPVPKTIR